MTLAGEAVRVRALLLPLLLLAPGCRSSAPPFPLPDRPSERAERLAREGRTGEALVELQRASRRPTKKALLPFFDCRLGRFPGWRRSALRAELLRGPLELAPVLIELEPEPKPRDVRELPPRRIDRRRTGTRR